MSLLAILAVATPSASAQAGTGTMTINKAVVGAPAATDFEFTVSPEVAGCTAEQTVTISGAGGSETVMLDTSTIGAISFERDDFTNTPVFNDVSIFRFLLGTSGVAKGEAQMNPELSEVDYQVFGTLTSPTPSGFGAFNLLRPTPGAELPGAEFYSQGSSLAFTIAADADLDDGLQVAELSGPDPVFVLNAREVDTGRYHPPLFELNSDGTGRLQNSNNTGGVNPGSGLVVDVDFGDEYIIDLSFDAAALTLAPTVPCTYTVTETPTDGYTTMQGTFTGLSADAVVDFVNTEILFCGGKVVTISTPDSGSMPPTFTGTAGDDVILGTSGEDIINGLGGDDTICSVGGKDFIDGGDGDDTLFGGDEGDDIFGGDGRDRIYGNGGDDLLLGDAGIDKIFGGDGNDDIFGDGGSDRIWAGLGDDTVFAGSGADRVWGGPGDDNLNGMGGKDLMWGGHGNDDMQGNHQSDILRGGNGRDTIRGAAGKDKLYGDAGNDMLFGGVNTDFLDGGPGNDVANGQRGRDKPLVVDVSGCIAEQIINC